MAHFSWWSLTAPRLNTLVHTLQEGKKKAAYFCVCGSCACSGSKCILLSANPLPKCLESLFQFFASWTPQAYLVQGANGLVSKCQRRVVPLNSTSSSHTLLLLRNLSAELLWCVLVCCCCFLLLFFGVFLCVCLGWIFVCLFVFNSCMQERECTDSLLAAGRE